MNPWYATDDYDPCTVALNFCDHCGHAITGECYRALWPGGVSHLCADCYGNPELNDVTRISAVPLPMLLHESGPER